MGLSDWFKIVIRVGWNPGTRMDPLFIVVAALPAFIMLSACIFVGMLMRRPRVARAV